MKKTITAGYSYKEEWEQTPYHCPSCGEKAVWFGGGYDYYAGQQHLCVNCNSEFWFYTTPRETTDRYDLRRIEELQK